MFDLCTTTLAFATDVLQSHAWRLELEEQSGILWTVPEYASCWLSSVACGEKGQSHVQDRYLELHFPLPGLCSSYQPS